MKAKKIAIILGAGLIVSAMFGNSEDESKEEIVSEKEDDKSDNSDDVEQVNETNESEDVSTSNVVSIDLSSEYSEFEKGGYSYVTTSDLDKYAVNMEGRKVYTVVSIDDIDASDSCIQSSLGDGLMMSNFYIKDNMSKYESSLKEDDVVAIAGTVGKVSSYSFLGKSISLNDCILFAYNDDAEKLRKDATSQELQDCLVVTESVADSEGGDISEADYKALCEVLDFNSIVRSPDSFDGKYCKLSGTVNQVIEGWFDTCILYIEDGSGNLWDCTYAYSSGESRFLEGDSVTVYGKCKGTSASKTLLGKQVVLPCIDVEYIE